jgi:hypothetical protein
MEQKVNNPTVGRPGTDGPSRTPAVPDSYTHAHDILVTTSKDENAPLAPGMTGEEVRERLTRFGPNQPAGPRQGDR